MPRSFQRHPLLLSSLLILLLVALVAGCDTLTTEAPPEDGLRVDEIEGWGFHQEQSARGKTHTDPPSPYAAFASRRVPGDSIWYQYRSFYLYFPEEIEAQAAGQIRHYFYRLRDEQGTVVSVVNAVIPAAPGAVDMLHRQVSHAGTGLPDSSGTASSGTTMGKAHQSTQLKAPNKTPRHLDERTRTRICARFC